MRSRTKVPSAAVTVTVMGALALLTAAPLRAQEMTGRSRIDVRTGVGVRVNSGTSTSVTGVETKTDAAGFLGGLGFSHWFSENVAGTLSVGVHSVGTETRAGVGGVETKTAVVVPFFVGVRRYLATSDPEPSARFFGSLEVGPVTGHESGTTIGSSITVGSITRTALGGRAGVGVDFHLGSRMMLGIGGGYALMTDFSEAIGGQKNHSGGDFGLSLGILFGG